MNNDFEIKITKKQKLYEINNEMCHNFYYLIHGRIYNQNKTRYKKFKFILFFDIFDIMEFYEIDFFDNNYIKDYIDEMIFSFTQFIDSYENCNYFYEICNDSIKKYNSLNGGF